MKSTKLKLFVKKTDKIDKPPRKLIQNNRIQKSTLCQGHKGNIIIGLKN